MNTVTWTQRESTQKRWTVEQAIQAAAFRLLEKNIPMYVNATLSKNGVLLDPDTKITLTELNRLADSLVDDSLHYNIGRGRLLIG
jgi:hypothetical protein